MSRYKITIRDKKSNDIIAETNVVNYDTDGLLLKGKVKIRHEKKIKFDNNKHVISYCEI